MVKLVTHYGAHINGLDEKGNSPLYYACLLGWPASFNFLVDRGADFKTVHKLPVGKARSPKTGRLEDSFEAKDAEPAVELMQIALHGLDRSTMVQNSIKQAYNRWGSIILFFIDTHSSSDIPEILLIELVETASCTGNIEAVVKFLHYYLGSDTEELAFSKVAVHLGPGLKSATREGRVEIVKLLLHSGADPKIASQDSRRPGRLGRQRQSGRLGELNHNTVKTVIGAVCEEDKWGELQPKDPRVLDACQLLFRRGISEADQVRLLAQASLQGRIEIVKDLWEEGVRVERVPMTSSVIVLDFFYAHQAHFDWVALQKYAIRVCNIGTLEWLTERAGMCLRSVEDFKSAVKPLADRYTRIPDPTSYSDFLPEASVDEQQKSMLWYLSWEYVHPSRVNLDLHSQVNELLLSATVQHLSRLQAFLREGVKSRCPATAKPPFSSSRNTESLYKVALVIVGVLLRLKQKSALCSFCCNVTTILLRRREREMPS